MIGRLYGKLLDKQPPQLLIDVNGVGYEVDAPMTTFYNLPEIGQAVTLHTHFVVREDAHQLYGFARLEERSLFRLLIKVNGVGPKLALTVLSSLEPDLFVQCVMNNDEAALVRVPGVGKKTAQRLMLDMRDRLKDWSMTASMPGAEIDSAAVTTVTNHSQEAISALVALGYKPQDASRAVSKVKHEGMKCEEIIRQVLQSFAT